MRCGCDQGTCHVIPASLQLISDALKEGRAPVQVIPGVCVLPARDGADRSRSVARAPGIKSDDLVVPTDDLGVVTADFNVATDLCGVSADDDS